MVETNRINNVNPYIIGISGESGVGKSTIAEIISLYFDPNETTVLSTDDLHKWERTNKMWEIFTHLNPDANNLDLGDLHIQYLSEGKPISRSIYNHKTGNFNDPITVFPKKTVIIEGLHAYFTLFSKQKTNLKIFVDTQEDLRIHWKIIRDTQERGYTFQQVLANIDKRKYDSDIIRKNQIFDADIVISLFSKNKIDIGNQNQDIVLDILIDDKNNSCNDLCKFIKDYFANLNEFFELSSLIGENIELCQDVGGNLSLKLNDKYMLIKSSGFSFKNVKKYQGYSLIDLTAFNSYNCSDDDMLNDILYESLAFSYHKKSSMETGFHVILDKYIVHTHAIYITLLLCLSNSRDLIKKIYSTYDFAYIEYANPGFELFNVIKNQKEKKKIYFLENHGIIVSSDDFFEVKQITDEINDIAKNYVKQNCDDFEDFNLSFIDYHDSQNFVFPDAAIFSNNYSKKETLAAHGYVLKFGSKIDNLRYLGNSNVEFLRNLKAEKYRKNL